MMLHRGLVGVLREDNQLRSVARPPREGGTDSRQHRLIARIAAPVITGKNKLSVLVHWLPDPLPIRTFPCRVSTPCSLNLNDVLERAEDTAISPATKTITP